MSYTIHNTCSDLNIIQIGLLRLKIVFIFSFLAIQKNYLVDVFNCVLIGFRCPIRKWSSSVIILILGALQYFSCMKTFSVGDGDTVTSFKPIHKYK